MGREVPLYTLVVRESGGGIRERYIKVRMDGPPRHRWMRYGRWVWIKHRGPVPAGMRVLRIDGDPLNDALDNLVLGTAADNAFLAHERVPDGHEKHYAKMRAGCAEHNRLRGRIKRATAWCASRWYLVDHARREVHNRPVKWRAAAYRVNGFDVPVACNGGGADPAALGWPGLQLSQACVLAALADAEQHRLDGDALFVAVERLRAERDEKPMSRRSLYSCHVNLKKRGFMTSVLSGGRRCGAYVLQPAALAARSATWTRAVPMWGGRLAAGECRGYTKVDPVLGRMAGATVGIMTTLERLAAAIDEEAA